MLEVSESRMGARRASRVRPNTQQVLTVKSVWAVSTDLSESLWHASGDPVSAAAGTVNHCPKLWIKSMASTARDF